MTATRQRYPAAAAVLAWVALTTAGHAQPSSAAATADANPFAVLYADVAPAVVRVVADNHYASGLIVSADGLVVTHADVAVANIVSVYLPDEPAVQARLLVRNRRLGLAVLQLIADQQSGADASDAPAVPDNAAAADIDMKHTPKPAPTARTWPAARLGTSAETQLGQWVATVAYPLGSDERQLTSPAIGTGLLSARGKFPTQLRYKDELLLTDAAANAGSEGGALVDRRGRVIGILVRPQHHRQTNTAMNLALPVEVLDPLLKKARENPDPPRDEARKPAFLGIVSDQAADHRCRIAEIVKDGPADKAGLKAGDIIVEADGEPVASFDDLLDALDEKRAGDTIRLTVERQRADKAPQRQEFTVPLGERPERP
jgi:serine protease Do